MNNNFNLNENAMNQIKNMVDNGNIADAISQISPEMIQNFSQMMNKNNTGKNNTNINSNSSNTNNSFDFSNLDINMVSKLSSAMSKINNQNDPRANLLQSLKPYLRDSKKEKLDQYVNLLNVTKIANVLKDDKKEN